VPGNGGAEGQEKRKGVIVRWGLEEAQSKSAERRTGTGSEVWCIREGCAWVADIDLEKFFDRVNHDVLLSRVRARGGACDGQCNPFSGAPAQAQGE